MRFNTIYIESSFIKTLSEVSNKGFTKKLSKSNYARTKTGTPYYLAPEVWEDRPYDYKCDVDIKIDDYQDYKADELMDGFNDAVELTHYAGAREHKKKWIQITLLLIAGVVLLNIMAKGLIENWLSLDDVNLSVFKEVFDITSWVFIWEAVSLMFLTPSETRVVSLTLVRRLHSVKFIDKNDKVLASEDYRDSYSQTVLEKKTRIGAKYMLLISGAAFLGLGVAGIISSFSDIAFIMAASEGAGESAGVVLVTLIVLAVVNFSAVIFETIGGIAALSSFVGKGRFYKVMLPFGILSFIVQVAGLVLSIAYGMISATYIIGSLIAAAYLLGAIILIATKEKVDVK